MCTCVCVCVCTCTSVYWGLHICAMGMEIYLQMDGVPRTPLGIIFRFCLGILRQGHTALKLPIGLGYRTSMFQDLPVSASPRPRIKNIHQWIIYACCGDESQEHKAYSSPTEQSVQPYLYILSHYSIVHFLNLDIFGN